MHNNGSGRILGANGTPTKLDLRVQYSPGPLASPVVFPPLGTDGGAVAPVFGGETRMEKVASRILAGAMDWDELDRCGQDMGFRRRLIEAAVVTAWELIGFASEYRGPQAVAEDAPSDEGEAAATEECPEPNAEKPSTIVLP